MKLYFRILLVLCVVASLSSCKREDVDSTTEQAETTASTSGQIDTAPSETQQLLSNYQMEDFLWIRPGVHDYFDVIEAMPLDSDEPVVKASKNSFCYPLKDGGEIAIWFDSKLAVNIVWHVKNDGTVYQLIPALEKNE